MGYLNYLYALVMASTDGLILSLLKAKNLKLINGPWVLPFSMIIYSLQPLIFYKSLSFESMTLMNILWDVISDIIVTIIGILVFGEMLSPTQWLGLALSLIGITLLGMH
jgi:multidrug transporter EmrE-like cation transporter